jgi:hypothetical protein
MEDWKRILWTDETKINRLGSDGRKWVWKEVGEPLSDRLVESTVMKVLLPFPFSRFTNNHGFCAYGHELHKTKSLFKNPSLNYSKELSSLYDDTNASSRLLDSLSNHS